MKVLAPVTPMTPAWKSSIETPASVELSKFISNTGLTTPVTWPLPSTCNDCRRSNSIRRPTRSLASRTKGCGKFTVTEETERVPLIVDAVGGFGGLTLMYPITGDAIVTVAEVYVPLGTALRSRSWCRPLNCAKSTICGVESTLTFVVPLKIVMPVTIS